MLAIYFIISLLICLAVIFIKNRHIPVIGSVLFIINQINLVFHSFNHIDEKTFVYFQFDRLGIIFLVVLTIISIPTFIHSYNYLKTSYSKRSHHYIAALIGLNTALTGAYISSSFTVTWILVEATTLMAAILIYHERTIHALEATWKYIFVCSVGIALAFMGILFFTSATEATGKELVSMQSLSEIVKSSNTVYLKIAFLFVLIGYSTKMELFPMHTVGIDANSVAPPPIGAFISSALVNVGFLSIFRVYIIFANHAELLQWMNHVLIIVGVLSLMVAAGYMQKASFTKRMLAYSTLENMGIVAIGIGVGGIGYYAALLHVILHSFTKSSLFFQLGHLYKVLKTFKIKESGEYFKHNSVGAILLILGIIAITAIPPSGMFLTELYIIKALIAKNYWIVLIIMLFLLCFIIYSLWLRIMHIVYSKPQVNQTFEPETKISKLETFCQFFLFGIVFIFCVYQPNQITDFIKLALINLN